MNKEPLSTSTEEVPKLKPALLDKIEAEKKPEKDYQKQKIVNYHNQQVGDF